MRPSLPVKPFKNAVLKIAILLSRFPGPTLRALELLQQERFRRDILMPDTVARMIEEGVKASVGEGA